MKNKILLIILLLYLLVFSGASLSAQAVFVDHPSDGTTAVTFRTGEKSIATFPVSFKESQGSPGTAIPEEENGRNLFNWNLKFSKTGRVFKDVSFAGPDTGYIVTELGSVFRSANGGDNWTQVMNLGFPYYWYGVEALTPDTVVIAGFNNQGDINSGVLRWSYDAGATWSSDLILTVPTTGVGWLDQVHFFNADTGIVFNSFSGGCWYTATGGKDTTDWTYISIDPEMGWFAGNIDAEPDGRVYATGIKFARSQDFGLTWEISGSADQVFDGGVDFYGSEGTYGWTGGGQISTPVSGWIHRSADGGENWSERLQTFPYPIRALAFFNPSTGIAVGGNLYDEAGGMYSTSDSGFTWNLDKNTLTEMFAIEYQVISPDSMDIWCAGSSGGGTGYTGRLYKARVSNLVTGLNETGKHENKSEWLGQNVPNPFSETTMIGFNLPVACPVSLKVFNLMGMEVAVLAAGDFPPGYSTVTFVAGNLPGGIYYYRLQAGNHSESGKMVLLDH